MAHVTTEPLFNVTNGPGPYRLLKAYMMMLEEHKKPIVHLTLRRLDEEGEMGNRIQAFFEVALLGPTSKGHPGGNPNGIRLLGRFVPYPDTPRQGIAPEFAQWQWEVVLESDRQGFVCKLNEPLSEEWTS